MPKPRLLSVRDVAERLNVREHQVLALIHCGRLPAKNVGIGKKPRWRIAEEDLACLDFQQFGDEPKHPRRRMKAAEIIEFF
jgi:excisionase family DNA binding protein